MSTKTTSRGLRKAERLLAHWEHRVVRCETRLWAAQHRPWKLDVRRSS